MSITCDPKYISLICDGRVDAMRRKAFVWNHELMGWVDLTAPPRISTDRAKYYNGDHTGEPYIWKDCPFCGHELPNPSNLYLREGKNPLLGQCDEGAE